VFHARSIHGNNHMHQYINAVHIICLSGFDSSIKQHQSFY